MARGHKTQQILEEAVASLSADAGLVCALRNDESEIVALFNMPEVYEKLMTSKELCLGAEAAEAGKPIYRNDYPYYKPEIPMHDIAFKPLKALAAAPIFSNGRLVGAISILSFSPDKRFTQHDAEKLGHFAERLANLPQFTLGKTA